MPFPANAIQGKLNKRRIQEKAKRLATEGFPSLPSWAKNWTPEEMEAYVETNVTDLASAKLVLQKLAWMCGALRDYMLLKQESD